MNDLSEEQLAQSIAIIGIAGRFPGADSIHQFWKNIVAGIDSLEIVPDEELRASGVPDEILNNPRCVKRAGILHNVDKFDASFFGYSPREAELIDPQQRLLLECAWETFEDAGYVPEAITGLTGVFAGAGIDIYFLKNLLSQPGRFEDNVDVLTFLGNDKDYLCSRIAYKLGLKGPCFAVNSACSTSLVAVQVGCQSLLTGQCDLALCGGVALQTPRARAYLYSEGEIFSKDGICRTFDKKAGGIVFGEGFGLAMLKRADEAIEDRDHIYAIIRSAVVNNDGADKAGFTAPSVNGQAELIALAQDLAGIHPDDISFIEAHGTGTKLGDAIEVAALSQAFRRETQRKRFCAIGSVKTNIGHLDAAAGITGLIKAACAVKHRMLPASLHCSQENPDLDLENSPFYVAKENVHFNTTEKPLFGGVSSFGMGGTNAHVIIQEPPQREQSVNTRKYHIVPVSAHSAGSIESACVKLKEFILENEEQPIQDIGYTLQMGRRAFSHRWFAVCEDTHECVLALEGTRGGVTGKGIAGEQQKVIFAFSGQGSQYPQMGYDLYNTEPVVKEVFDRARVLFQDLYGEDFFSIVFSVETNFKAAMEHLTETQYTQPALFTLEYAVSQLLMSYGIMPDALVGHSIGEYVAAACAGVFTFEDGFRIVAARGRLMAAMAPGAMVYVACSEKKVLSLLVGNLVVALVNAPDLCVVSGTVEDITQFEKNMEVQNIRCGRVKTSHAFHSPLMDEAARLLKEEVNKYHLNSPTIPFVSNVSGTWILDEQCTNPEYWARQLRDTVRFSSCMKTLFEKGYHSFIEVGPGNSLSTLMRQNTENGKEVAVIQTVRHYKQTVHDQAYFMSAIGNLWLKGYPVDWALFYTKDIPNRISLPTYPFERKRYWIERSEPSNGAQIENYANKKAVTSDDVIEKDENTGKSISREVIAGFVMNAWTDVLGVTDCGGDDNFQMLGGNSLMLSQVVSRLNNHLPFNMPLSFLMGSTTINEQVVRVNEFSSKNVSNGSKAALEIEKATTMQLSPAQKRLWYICQLDPVSPAFNIVHTFRIYGQLQVPLLEKALKSMVARHAIFRSRFLNNEGDPEVTLIDNMQVQLEVIDCYESDGAASEKEALRRIKNEAVKPFNLSSGPLFGYSLYRIDEQSYILVIKIHHIISDGWSMSVMLHECSEMYNAQCENREATLPEVSIGYFDYAQWINKTVENKVIPAEERAFWEHYFSGGIPVLQMPADFKRPETLNYSGGIVEFTLPEYVSAALKQYALVNNVTPFSILLSIFGLFLGRYSRQNNIVVGCPSANRMRVEFEPLVGLFLNMLPIKIDIDSADSVKQLILKTYENTIEVFSHQNMQFGQLVELLQPERMINYNPVFQTMFAYNNYSVQSDHGKFIDIIPGIADRGASEYDLSLYMWEYRGTIHGAMEYSSELFTGQTVKRFAGNFTMLLERALAAADASVGRLSLFSDNEIAERMRQQFVTTTNFPKEKTVYQLLDESMVTYSRAVAITDGTASFTYDEVKRHSNRVCRHLQGMGVVAGDLVGVHMARSVHILPALIGIMKAGGAYVPLDPLFPEERIEYMVEDAAIRFIVADSENGTKFKKNSCVNIFYYAAEKDDSLGDCEENIECCGTGGDLAYVLYTSGSTGNPKGVEITHRSLVNFLLSMQKKPGISTNDKLLAVTTISFDIAGLEIFLPIVAGATIVLASGSDAADGFSLKKMLSKHRINIMQATPATWRILLDAGWSEGKGLKILCGGEALSRDLADNLLKTGAEVWNMYGPTETTIWSSVAKVEYSQVEPDIGLPIDNTQLFIADDLLQLVPPGVVGELFIGGEGLARGYHNKGDLTKDRFVEIEIGGTKHRVYRTGDLVRESSDGKLEFMGRSDRQVKIRGFRIELEEIEVVVNRHEDVEQSIVATYDTPTGKELVAYVRPIEGRCFESQVIRDVVAGALPLYMVPAYIVVVNSFPLTPNGKVDRKKLPPPVGVTVSEQKSKTTPEIQDEIEAQLVEIWKQVLGRDDIAVTDDYFDLGGSSLVATRLFARIEKKVGVLLPLAVLYKASTVAKLAEHIRNRRSVVLWKSLVEIQTKGSKPPLFLIHGAGGNVLLYRSLSVCLGEEYPVYGLQSRGLNNPDELIRTVEEMAQNYLAEIKSVSPSGPYFLGGYCLGGLIAYEIARLLQKNGDTVAMVALISTSAHWVQLDAKKKIGYAVDNVLFHLKNMADADGRGKYLFFRERAEEALRRMRRSLEVKASAVLHALKIRKEHPMVAMERVNDNAAIHYQPGSFNGSVTLFKPKGADKYALSASWGWDTVDVGKLNVVQLNGYLNGILVEPFVQELAQEMRKYIDDTVK